MRMLNNFHDFHNLAGAVGIELTYAVLEAAVLPLDDTPVSWRKIEESNPDRINDPSVFETALIPYQSIFLAEYTGFEPVEDLRLLLFSKQT